MRGNPVRTGRHSAPSTSRKRATAARELPTILVDDREKLPLRFSASVATEIVHLAVGDYSLRGASDVVAIERKRLDELAKCCGLERERFVEQIKRLRPYPVRALVVEADMADVVLPLRVADQPAEHHRHAREVHERLASPGDHGRRRGDSVAHRRAHDAPGGEAASGRDVAGRVHVTPSCYFVRFTKRDGMWNRRQRNATSCSAASGVASRLPNSRSKSARADSSSSFGTMFEIAARSRSRASNR